MQSLQNNNLGQLLNNVVIKTLGITNALFYWEQAKFCSGSSCKNILISGSVFLERDLLVHQTFGLIFDELNEDSNYLNGTRVDYNIQYSDLDQFDAYQKACMEMTYRYPY